MSEVRLKYLPRYTYEDSENWEGRWELIYGIPYAMSPSPGIRHQEVTGNIIFELNAILRNSDKWKTLMTVDWRIPDMDDNTVLQPDNLIICKDVKGKYLTDTPVMIFEILSPSTAMKDRHIKYEIYESKGVKYYIIVDIDLNIAEVYELINGTYKKVMDAKNDIVKFDLETDCSVNFNFENIWK